MSTTVKKESTRKKSTKDAEAEAVEVETAEVKAPAKKTAAKAASKKAAPKAVKSEPESDVSEIKEAVEVAPKRKYTRKAKTDETESAEADTSAVAPTKTVAKKTASKKVAEESVTDENDDIETQIYNLIKNTVDGVYQKEIWKQMNIDSRKCSRILKKLLDTEQIIREEAVAGGTKTYLLKTVSEERKRNYDVLMVKDMFSPCTGCMGECRPEYCPALTFWIMNIHDKPEELYAAMGYNSDVESETDEIEMPPEFLEEMGEGEAGFDDIDDEEIVFE